MPRLAWFLEAALFTGLARMSVLCLPFRFMAAGLGTAMAEAPEEASEAQRRTADTVAWAIAAAGRRVPWDSNCLAQALAATLMLRLRGVPSTLYLGVALEPGGMRAHAWVRCGRRILTGARGRDGFRVVASFARLNSRR